MRLGFDGKRAMQNYTGLGNYSRYILRILSEYYPHNEYDIFVPKPFGNKRLQSLTDRYSCLKIILPTTSFWKSCSKIWRTFGLSKQLRQEGIEVYHGLSNELPLNIQKSGIKSVVTIHDLIFLRYPHFYSFIDRQIYAYKFRKACIHANRIIAISECTKRDIITFFHIPAEKIITIYQGCDQSFLIPSNKEEKTFVRNKYQLPEHYILSVGSIEKRKNALSIVKAIEDLEQEIHLVLIGRRTKYAKQIDEYVTSHHLRERVTILDQVPFADLPAIYQQAEVFVYPSLYEGFGIPIIEALNSGVPVVAATNSCLEEAGGPSSLYVAPNDVQSLKSALMKIIRNESFRTEMIYNGKNFAKKFSEKEQAEKLMTIYEELLQQQK